MFAGFGCLCWYAWAAGAAVHVPEEYLAILAVGTVGAIWFLIAAVTPRTPERDVNDRGRVGL